MATLGKAYSQLKEQIELLNVKEYSYKNIFLPDLLFVEIMSGLIKIDSRLSRLSLFELVRVILSNFLRTIKLNQANYLK